MSKRKLLNSTSHKKRNAMMNWSNTKSDGTVQAATNTSPFVAGGTGGIFLFTPTSMDLGNNAANTVANNGVRTSSTCFLRGFSEHLRFQTSSPQPWLWRRVCFTTKGDDFRSAYSTDTPTIMPYDKLLVSTGWQRAWINMNINNSPNTISALVNHLFRGTKSIDWNDYVTAAVDTGRVTVKYDKTTTLASGNSNGIIREKKLWHPMNANILYDDTESGMGYNGQPWSTDSKAGMGDYYIMDFFQVGTGGTTSDILQIQSSSTIYWHEK